MADIGIFGGTFDPLHNAHLKIAEAAYKELMLDKILFLPCGNPPHKSGRRITDKHIRYEMVKEAIKDIPYFEVSDYEVKKESFSYTAQTLEYFKGINPEDNYFFIIGEDSLAYLEKWYRPETIVKLSTILVYARGENPDTDFEISRIKKLLDAKIHKIQAPVLNLSSTDIRNLTASGESVDGLVPGGVLKIIKREKLYIQENTDA